MSVSQVETDTRTFIDSLKTWDGVNPPFATAVFGALAHAVMVGIGGAIAREAAVEHGVAEMTIIRWANGAARPHPSIAKIIVAELADRLEKAHAELHPINRPELPTDEEVDAFLRIFEHEDDDDPDSRTPDR